MCGVLDMCGVIGENGEEKGQFDLRKIDPGELTGSDLYRSVNNTFYPFVSFHQDAAWVNSCVESLKRAIETAEISANAAIDIANHYQGSILQQDLHQNYQKLMALKDFVSKFEPLREEDIR